MEAKVIPQKFALEIWVSLGRVFLDLGFYQRLSCREMDTERLSVAEQEKTVVRAKPSTARLSLFGSFPSPNRGKVRACCSTVGSENTAPILAAKASRDCLYSLFDGSSSTFNFSSRGVRASSGA